MKKARITNDHGLDTKDLAQAKSKYKHVCKAETKITTIILCMSGMGVNEISRMIGIRPNTAGKYIHDFNEGGLEKLLDYGKSPGKPCKLTQTQQGELRDILVNNPQLLTDGMHSKTWGTAEIQSYIDTTYQVQMGKAGIYQMLKRMGFVYEDGTYVLRSDSLEHCPQ